MPPLARSLLLALAAGLLTAAPAQAIVGGSPADEPFPHMAAVEFRSGSGFAFGCGGSLIRPDVVLTAAHCVSDDDPDVDTVPAGSVRVQFPPLDAPSRRRSAGGERIAVTQVLEHPAFDDSREGGSDVALLRLASPASFARTIRLAGPADAAAVAPGRPATVSGWGALFFQGPPTDELREVEVPIVSDEDCQAFPSITTLDEPTQLCAGELEGARDSCQGDSGGPLMVRDGGGAWILAGVVSQGVGCGTPTQFGVYAEVGGEPLRSWVEGNASTLSAADDAPPPATQQPAPARPGPPADSTSTSSSSSSGAAPAPAQQPAPVAGRLPTSGSAAPRRARITLPAALGSLRSARRRGAFLVGLRFNVPVTVSATLTQRGRTIARGSRRGLRTGTLRIRLVRGARPRAGRAVLRVVVRDRAGRRYTARRTVALRR